MRTSRRRRYRPLKRHRRRTSRNPRSVDYMIASPTHPGRARIDGGGTTTTIWVPDERYGRFASSVDAKRAFMEAMDADLRGSSDEHIRRHFDAQARNIGMAKVVCVAMKRNGRSASRNPVPPPPSYANQRAWRHWASVTFARGTSIMTREPLLGFLLTPGRAYVATTITIPAGAKGAVREIRLGSAPGEFNVTLDFLPSAYVPAGAWTAIYASQIEDTLEPLDDNWGPAPRPLGRQHLPTSQRSWLKPNITLDKLAVPLHGYTHSPADATWPWLVTTFAPGTPVKLLRRDLLAFGARGVVMSVDTSIRVVVVKIVDARDREGIPVSSLIGREFHSYRPMDELEPMVDNWATAPQRMHRWQLPRAQRSWLKPNTSTRVDEHGVELHGEHVAGFACRWCRTPIAPVSIEWAARTGDDYICEHGNHAFTAAEIRLAQHGARVT